MKIVLIGFMCSGKSKVGRLLAEKLNIPHFDTDEILVKKSGHSIAEIITRDGEAAFRALEKAAVNEAAAHAAGVISTGGGVPLDAGNMTALKKNAKVIWLKVSPETVLKRAGNFKSRPLIDPANPLESIKKRMEERAQAYAQAEFTVDADSDSPQAIVDKILKL